MPTCLITGASRGIGLELARNYAKAGWTVLAAVRNPAKATDLNALAATASAVHVHALDVTDVSSIERVAAAIGKAPIDLLVANAGVIGPRGSLGDTANTPTLWADVLATNVTGVFFTVRAFADSVVAARGKIAIISSMMGSSQTASGSSYLYRASKAAAANLGANLAVELKPKGVAVGIYHPGWVKTDMGGSGAAVEITDSAAGLAERFAELSLANSGSFVDYAGTAYKF